ncbi:MAG: 50S ribosomal protein L4 [Flavobacteriales bacterium]|nr:50S ribosomal protein L4 [Flavobacteriales bacterium]
MELEIYNISGKKTSKKVKLDDNVFNIEPNDHSIYMDVRLYRNNQRQGNSKAKGRSEVTGSRRKIKKQKGSGSARAGSIQSPIFRKGGRAFGPQVRDYSFKLNKKYKKLARKSAFSYKVKDNGIMILESFSFDEPKTKKYLELLKNLKLDDKKTLMILNDADTNVYLASRNIPKCKVIAIDELTTYDIVNANNIMMSEDAIKSIETILN